MTKIYIKCKQEKPINHFHKRYDKRRNDCKECRNTYLKEWGKRNPEKREPRNIETDMV